MRNFLNAAIAGATALALTFGGTSVATAADAPESNNSSTQQDNTQNPGLSSWVGQNIFKIGEKGGKGDITDGEKLFGSSKDWENANEAGKRLYVFTAILGVTAVAALAIAPAYNFIKYGPFA